MGKNKSYKNQIKEIVGDEVFETWIKMLKTIGPGSRTHRLAVVVASMLQYTFAAGSKIKAKDKPEFLEEMEDVLDGGDYEDSIKITTLMAEALLKEAKVRSNKVNSRGQNYSVAETAAEEYYRWSDMPWE